MTDHYTLRIIGRVTVDQQGFALSIDRPYRDGLTALDGFTHVNVLFWCHYLDEPEYRDIVLAERPYKKGPPQVGIFATRSPARPNPIALTPVAVSGIDHGAGIVRIAYIDAEPDSPILDIKPYLPAVDRVRRVATPEWCADWPQWYEESATFDWSAVFENAR